MLTERHAGWPVATLMGAASLWGCVIQQASALLFGSAVPTHRTPAAAILARCAAGGCVHVPLPQAAHHGPPLAHQAVQARVACRECKARRVQRCAVCTDAAASTRALQAAPSGHPVLCCTASSQARCSATALPCRCLFLCWLPYAAGASPLEDCSSTANGGSSNGAAAAAAEAHGGGVESAKDRTMYAVSDQCRHLVLAHCSCRLHPCLHLLWP